MQVTCSCQTRLCRQHRQTGSSNMKARSTLQSRAGVGTHPTLRICGRRQKSALSRRPSAGGRLRTAKGSGAARADQERAPARRADVRPRCPMLVHAILTDSARLCAAWVEFAFRTVQRPAQPNLRRAQDAKSSVSKSDAHKTHKVGVLNQVGRKRGFRKVVGFPVAGPLFGASTPVRRNGTGPSRGKARRGYTSPIPAEIGRMRWV